MSNLEKEFVPDEIALELREIEFDEECIGTYNSKGHVLPLKPYTIESGAILYSQAFRWFREKYDLFTHIEKGENPKNFYPIIDNVSHKYNPKLWFDTYEEAELACLIKLIEIVKEKQ